MKPYLAITLFLLAGITAAAQSSSISLMVTDTAGGAGGQSSGSRSGDWRREAAGDGRARELTVPGLPAGRYRLEVERDGFRGSRSMVDAPPGDGRRRTDYTSGWAPLPSGSRLRRRHRSRARSWRSGRRLHRCRGQRLATIESSQAVSLFDFLGRRSGSVNLNEIQGNPFQADLNYRGYTASPLLGTPQGISVYLDGVRFNQPFGDVVSWDLIPRQVISEVAMLPGSNPIFGLNTLGGALVLRTKDGQNHPGTIDQHWRWQFRTPDG
jgi:hypothetical protein